jgi:hypothetical protein
MFDFPLDLERLASLGFNIDFIEKSLPKNYKKGLTAEEQSIAKREAKDTMSRAKDPSVGSKELYKDWESDKRYRGRNKNIPKSKATEAFESRFAEDSGIDEALRGKAKASGISLSILREVYNRGMAAWRSGHRPGVAPQQWALGRVNSFVTGVGKARKADADLWEKHKKTKRP